MTLEEKVAQLVAIWNRKRDIQDAQGRFDPAKAQALIGAGIGQVARPSEIPGGGSRPAEEAASFANAVQRSAVSRFTCHVSGNPGRECRHERREASTEGQGPYGVE